MVCKLLANNLLRCREFVYRLCLEEKTNNTSRQSYVDVLLFLLFFDSKKSRHRSRVGNQFIGLGLLA